MNKLTRWKLIIAVGILASVISVKLIASEFAQASDPQPRFYIQVNGESTDLVSSGTVTFDAVGALNDRPNSDGICDIPRFDLVGEPVQGLTTGVIEVVVTEQCGLRVVKADWTSHSSLDQPEKKTSLLTSQGLREILSALLPVSEVLAHHSFEIRGWAKAEINDRPGIDLAATYAELEYWDYGSGVHDGHDRVHRCTTFWLSGWVRDSCTSDWDVSGPTRVFAETTGRFHNNNCIFGADRCSRELSSRFTGRGSFQNSWICTQSNTQPPPGTHYRCSGGWEIVN